jgi:hypothetical protein
MGTKISIETHSWCFPLINQSQYFCFFLIFLAHKFIPSHSFNTFIRRHLKRSLHLPIACEFCEKTSLGCRSEKWTRSCLSASRRTTSWATPHRKTELRRNLLATPHPIELCCTLTKLRRTLLDNNNCEASTGHTQKRKNIERGKDGWHQAYIC